MKIQIDYVYVCEACGNIDSWVAMSSVLSCSAECGATQPMTYVVDAVKKLLAERKLLQEAVASHERMMMNLHQVIDDRDRTLYAEDSTLPEGHVLTKVQRLCMELAVAKSEREVGPQCGYCGSDDTRSSEILWLRMKDKPQYGSIIVECLSCKMNWRVEVPS